MLLRKRKEKGQTHGPNFLKWHKVRDHREDAIQAVVWSRSSLISISLVVFISRPTWEFLCQIKHRMPDPHWNLGRIYITSVAGKSAGPALQHSYASWLTGPNRLSEPTLRLSQIAVKMMPIRQCITLQAESRLVVHPMPVGARDMRHNFRGSKRSPGSPCAKNPCITTPPTHFFPPMKAQSMGLPNEKGDSSFVKRLCYVPLSFALAETQNDGLFRRMTPKAGLRSDFSPVVERGPKGYQGRRDPTPTLTTT